MLRLRAWPIAAAHAACTAISTAGGVLLVIALRPGRARALPFYSDASHADPERVLLALGENLACLLLPLVILFERAQHTRLLRGLGDGLAGAGAAGTAGGSGGRAWPGLAACARVNFGAAVCTLGCFFVTANVPSSAPWTPVHQAAASGLILGYAVQASCKAALARALRLTAAPPAARAAIAAALWGALLVTWVCYAGLVATGPHWTRWRATRRALSTAMAAVVHVATAACVALMAILAHDLRHEVLVVEGVAASRALDAPYVAWVQGKDAPAR